jgi:hypothetical protein
MTDKAPEPCSIRFDRPERSVFALDLPDDRTAFALAQSIAQRTGRSVTVRDVDGVLLATFHDAPLN